MSAGTDATLLRWYAQVQRYAQRYARHTDLAGDLAHAMMVDILEHPDRFHNLRYVYLKAVDQCIPRHQHHQIRERGADSWMSWEQCSAAQAERLIARMASQAPSVIESVEHHLDTERHIQAMPRRHHGWLRRVIFAEVPMGHIAAEEHVNKAAFSSRVRTVRQHLRRRLAMEVA
jgi:DNA-directed RNA polymerase specialized sigma24 family protein